MKLVSKSKKKNKKRFVKLSKQEKIGDSKDIKTVNKNSSQEK